MTDPIDLSAYNLVIATPMFAGKPEHTFKKSLDATKEMLEAHGGKVVDINYKHCADIYLARTRLLGHFLRMKDPQPTHMLFCDDDMDWNPEDVAYMLMLNRDFLAAAGPRKKYPIDFAYQLCDDYSNPIPLYHEIETNVAEVSAVGAAFMMISRACAQKIVDAHPEQEFDFSDTEVECAVFDPIIVNVGPEYPRRRLSEDYSFCYRWRKLGGKVEVLLSVRLGHTGSHRFEGCLLDELAKRDPEFNAPENTDGTV